MAATVGVPTVQELSSGSFRVTVTDVTMDASYPTGGLAVTKAQLGLNTVIFAQASIVTTAAAGAAVDAVYDVANQKVKLIAAAAEVANAANTTGLVVRVTALGV